MPALPSMLSLLRSSAGSRPLPVRRLGRGDVGGAGAAAGDDARSQSCDVDVHRPAGSCLAPRLTRTVSTGSPSGSTALLAATCDRDHEDKARSVESTNSRK